MRYRKKVGLLEFKLRCVNCGADQIMTDYANLNLGDVIHPGVGGHSEYGRCKQCRKGGLKVIDRSDLRPPSDTPLYWPPFDQGSI